ncbi:hypothetical protein OROHE_003928 [Orobanche hederae]
MDSSISKRSKPQDLDRLSELPDSLIFNIFEFLPMNDVVSTQILSHRWENLWTITPYLHFDNKSANSDKFRNFVNRCLICWKGEKMQKFKVSSHTFNKSLFGDMGLWIRFAVENGVKELDTSFDLLGYDPYKDVYRVPKCLYSCPSLQKLSFLGEMNGISGNVVQWNQLKSLKIKCFLITRDAIELLLSKCHVLEIFMLSFQDKDNNLSLNFRSTSLKKLLLSKGGKDNYFSDNISTNTELRIWTPNLEILSISGVTYRGCWLMDVPSLNHATLSFSNSIDHLRVTFRHTLWNLRHVKELTLSIFFLKVLGYVATRNVAPLFKSVVFLSLDGFFEDHENIVGLLEIFPKLKTLVILEKYKLLDLKSEKNSKPNPSESFLVELRRVEVTWNMCDFSLFPLIEILLKYASKLEKMLFRVKRTVPPSELLVTSQTKLLRMPRLSPNAELIFCEI